MTNYEQSPIETLNIFHGRKSFLPSLIYSHAIAAFFELIAIIERIYAQNDTESSNLGNETDIFLPSIVLWPDTKIDTAY